MSRKGGKKLDAWRIACAGLGSCVVLAAAPARAQEGEDEAPPIEFHGFASQGFILTLKNDYLAEASTDGSFEFAEVGFNFTKELTERLSTGRQA